MIKETDLPEGWKIINLPDVVFFQEGPGVRKHQFTKDGIKLLNGRNIVGNKLILNNTETYISREEATTKYNHFLVEEGDLIIASSGIKVDYFHKKIAFAKKEHLPLCMNTSTIRFRALNTDILDIKYFRFFLMTDLFAKQVNFHITGSAQLNFGPSHLKKMRVVLPPLPVQKKIADILEKAEKLKTWRAEADKLTDEFLKSTFMEMFGDPVKNPMGWEIVKLGKIGDVSSGITLNGQRRENKKNLFPYLRVANVYRNKLDLTEIKKIHVYDNEIKRFLLKKNDVLVVEGHGNIEEIGRTAVWKEKISNCVHQNHIIKARLDEQKMMSEFLSYFLNMYGNHGYFSSKSNTTSGLNTINTTKIRNAKIPFPPLPLQQKFASIVQQVEQVRQYQQESKAHIDDLFNALMQKAFRGELVA